MRWQGISLIDAPTPATFTGGELEFGAQTLRFLSRDPSDIHAVGPRGADFRMRKVGLTVSRYTAECDGRVYAVNRTRGKRREITDASGSIAATTRGLPDGTLELRPAGELTLDLVFISWALTWVDAPARRTLR